jgi:Protein of unknown function (DUF3592)
MADEEPKVPPPLFPPLDRGAGPPDDSESDPMEALRGIWYLFRLVLVGGAVAVGLFMSSCGTFLAVSQLAQTPLGPGSRSAPGVVVGLKRSESGSRFRTVYAPVVRFNVDGRDFEITSRLATNTPPPVGQHVQVRYDAATPERAVLVGWAEWGMAVEWMVIGGALLAAGIFMWRRRWWQRPNWWW